MKLALFAVLASTAAAFTPPTYTFAVGKKAPPKAAKTVAVKKVATKVVPKATKPVVAAKVVPKKVVAKVVPQKVVAKVVPKKVVAKVVPQKVVAKVVPKKVVAKVVPKKIVAKVVPKKVVIKKVVATKPKPVIKAKARSFGTVPSKAIPGEVAPALLDGSLIGDVGFDPCFLSTKADSTANYFQGILGGSAPSDGLTWYREAELMHGRICMVAVVGFIAPGFGTLGGNEWSDSFGYTNPLEAFSKAPSASLFQIFAFMGALEFRRINIITKDGNSYTAGDSQKWGQGPGRWNPLGFAYTPAEYAEKQLQEIKHARLAMIALLGLVFQANASGVGVVDQLSSAFVFPGYVAKAGYFFPDGI